MEILRVTGGNVQGNKKCVSARPRPCYDYVWSLCATLVEPIYFISRDKFKLQAHLKTHSHKCEPCNIEFDNFHQLRKHKVQDHSSKDKRTCPICQVPSRVLNHSDLFLKLHTTQDLQREGRIFPSQPIRIEQTLLFLAHFGGDVK